MLTGSLGFGLGINNVVTAAAVILPVTWLSFDVKQEYRFVDWRWTLAMEENVAYYTPQYSRNGIHFTDAGKITDLRQDLVYDYNMPLSFTGNIFFRVLEVDLNGKDELFHHTIAAIRPFKYLHILSKPRHIRSLPAMALCRCGCSRHGHNR